MIGDDHTPRDLAELKAACRQEHDALHRRIPAGDYSPSSSRMRGEASAYLSVAILIGKMLNPPDVRMADCPACDGAGEVCVGDDGGSWTDPPSPIFEPCQECEGLGQTLREVEPVEPEDVAGVLVPLDGWEADGAGSNREPVPLGAALPV